MSLKSAEKVDIAFAAVEAKKANQVIVLDMQGLTLITDYFIICSGNSGVHIRAIADAVEEELLKRGIKLGHCEGYNNGRWVLLDYGDLVVHIFGEEEREFYSLESLWGDAKVWKQSVGEK